MNDQYGGLLQILGRLGRWAEDILLVGLLAVMIGLAALLILLRNVFGSGLLWGDELLRILVLWLGLLGAVAASRDDNHIKIDVLSKLLPQRIRLAARMLLDLFTALVCGIIAWHAGRFVQMELAFGAPALGRFPAWIFESILPAAFGLIAYRYAVYFLLHLRRLLAKKASP